MIFKILIGYLKGYVNIDVQGYYIQRFINVCISKGIFLWNLKPKKSTYINVNVEIADFKKLREIGKTTKCKIKINERKGLPFILNKYKKRKIFFLLLIVIALFIIGESQFVWNIEIDGIDRVSKEEILSSLEKNGLKIGAIKSKINVNELINNIRLERKDIAWMNIKLSGTNVIVQIAETTEKPEIIPFDEYCNIIAKKDAEIMKITAVTGTIIAKPGDKVTTGSILIGGWMEGNYTGIRYVHAMRRCNCKSKIFQKGKNGAKSKIRKANWKCT